MVFKKLRKNSKKKEYLNHIGMDVIFPITSDKHSDVTMYIRGKILNVIPDIFSHTGVSYVMRDISKEYNQIRDTNTCYLVDEEQKLLSEKYGIVQGDKVTYKIEQLLQEGTVLCIFDNGDVRTDSDGVRCNSEILTVNGKQYNKLV
jgi:hypothetical protein